MVPGKKNILSGGRHLLSGGRHLISGGRQINCAIFVSVYTFALGYQSGLLQIHLVSGKDDPLSHTH